MKYIGCDFHPSFQQLAMLDTETGETLDLKLKHEGGEARRFYESLKAQEVIVGIEVPETRTGLSTCWDSWDISCGWATRLPSVARTDASRSTSARRPADPETHVG